MNISQGPKESAQNFLFRANELKEKLMRKSSDEDEGEDFSSELIQGNILCFVETGLYRDAVKFQLRPHLCSFIVRDEMLS